MSHAEDDLIPEVKNMQLETCTNCFAGKQKRTSFQSRPPTRRKASLELVHTVVCSVDIKSHAGLQNFVTFINDHNRNLWVSTLKMMDQVLFVFKDFHARVRYCPSLRTFMLESKEKPTDN